MNKLRSSLIVLPVFLYISCKSYSTDTILGKWEINIDKSHQAIETFIGEKFDWTIVQQEYNFLEDRLLTKTESKSHDPSFYTLKKISTNKLEIIFTDQKRNPKKITLTIIDINNMAMLLEGKPVAIYLVRKVKIKE